MLQMLTIHNAGFIMDRLITITGLLLAFVQAQTMFFGAYQISAQMNWKMIGNYAQQEAVIVYKEVVALKTELLTFKPEPPKQLTAKERRKAMFVDAEAANAEEQK
jgi:hypothetical protein